MSISSTDDVVNYWKNLKQSDLKEVTQLRHRITQDGTQRLGFCHARREIHRYRHAKRQPE